MQGVAATLQASTAGRLQIIYQSVTRHLVAPMLCDPNSHNLLMVWELFGPCEGWLSTCLA